MATEVVSVQPKWVGKSMTIWGAVVSAVSIFVPIVKQIATQVGTDIPVEPSDITNVGSAVGTTIQAVGGLAGLLLTWIGRVRAGKNPQPIVTVPTSEPVAVTVEKSPKKPSG